MRKFRPDGSNMDNILIDIDIVEDAEIADAKLPDRRLAEEWRYKVG
jgi:hypothetical protein